MISKLWASIAAKKHTLFWIAGLGILCLLAVAGCAAPEDMPLTHSAKIEVSGENRYKAARLIPQIYNAANSDLSDLLLKNSKGENVPYFIRSGLRESYTSRETYVLELINSYLKDDSFYFDYKTAAAQSADTIATSLEFSTNNINFAKAVDIYGSYDNINWDFIQKDTLYAVDDTSKLAIGFARPQKYTHYRLKLANNMEQIIFTAANLIYSIETSEENYFIESLAPTFIVEHTDNKRTDIMIEGLINLRLCDMTIDTDSMFKRTVSTAWGLSVNKELYNLSLNGTSYADTTLPLNWQIPIDDTYTIMIADADDKPININGVTVRYYADEVVFEGAAGEVYTLEFGRDVAKRAPVYDIERYKNDILSGAIDRAAIGAITYAAPQQLPQYNFTLIFNIVIVVVALLLGIVILLKLKKK